MLKGNCRFGIVVSFHLLSLSHDSRNISHITQFSSLFKSRWLSHNFYFLSHILLDFPEKKTRKSRQLSRSFWNLQVFGLDMSDDYETPSPDGTQFPDGLRVLAVDDNVVCLKILVTLLEQCRYKGQFLMLSWSIYKTLDLIFKNELFQETP